jgi:hypothetical protein
MSPEQIAELKPRDRLMSRLLRKAEFVRHTAHGVVIRWEGEREEGELYSLSDPILKSLTFYGHWDPGERPWFDPKIKLVRSRRTTGKSRGRARRRSTRRGSDVILDDSDIKDGGKPSVGRSFFMRIPLRLRSSHGQFFV